jgi:hypothetical protein
MAGNAPAPKTPHKTAAAKNFEPIRMVFSAFWGAERGALSANVDAAADYQSVRFKSQTY